MPANTLAFPCLELEADLSVIEIDILGWCEILDYNLIW
jgi:hypothetical protein